MTALNFILTPDAVYLVMDTLAIHGASHEPRCFVTKMYPMPHLDGIICGTGFQQPISEWCRVVQQDLVVADMVELDQHAPALLDAIFSRHVREYGAHDLTVTLYHFGYSVAAGRFVGYAYRSEHDFASEMFAARCVAVKPEIPSVPEIKTVPDDLIAVVELQREYDNGRPIDQRLGIGGDIQFFGMVKNLDSEDGHPIRMTIQRCHRFSDYEDLLMEMRANLAR